MVRTTDHRTMKNLSLLLCFIVAGLFALPANANAGCGYDVGYKHRIGYSSCGCPIYQRRVIVSYDCYRRPIYRYYSIPVVHHCRTYYRPVSRPVVKFVYRSGCRPVCRTVYRPVYRPVCRPVCRPSRYTHHYHHYSHHRRHYHRH